MGRFFGTIEEVQSPYNGKIQVLGGIEGPRIVSGGLSQSGWLVKKIWRSGIKRVKKYLASPTKVLILGLGGGSAAQLINEYFPEAQIKGIDIDPEMVALGKKYLRLGEIRNLEVVIADALTWVDRNKSRTYDLILVDLFNGTKIPHEFKTKKFIKAIKELTHTRGIVAFNHFYSREDKKDSEKFLNILRKVFPLVISVTPEANIIFLCFNN